MTKEQTENHCCKKEKQEQRKNKRMYRKKSMCWKTTTLLLKCSFNCIEITKVGFGRTMKHVHIHTHTYTLRREKNERRQMNFLWEINKNLAFIIHIMSTIPLRLHRLNRHSIWFREQFRADLYGSLISFVECFIRYVNTPLSTRVFFCPNQIGEKKGTFFHSKAREIYGRSQMGSKRR